MQPCFCMILWLFIHILVTSVSSSDSLTKIKTSPLASAALWFVCFVENPMAADPPSLPAAQLSHFVSGEGQTACNCRHNTYLMAIVTQSLSYLRQNLSSWWHDDVCCWWQRIRISYNQRIQLLQQKTPFGGVHVFCFYSWDVWLCEVALTSILGFAVWTVRL